MRGNRSGPLPKVRVWPWSGRRTAVMAGSAMVLTLSLTASASAGASPMDIRGADDIETYGTPGDTQTVWQSAEEAEKHDLALIAEATGWSIEEVESQRTARDAAAVIAKQIAANRPGALVGSALSQEPGGAPSIYVQGPADKFMKSLVERAAVEINLMDEQPYSFAELQGRARDVHERLRAAGFRYVVSAPDITNGRIVAEVTSEPELRLTPHEVLDGLPLDLRFSVDLKVSNVPIVSDDHAYGGMRMRNSGNRNTCTSGWSVVNDSGVTGVTTAGHCGVDQIVEPGVGTWAASHQDQHIGTWGDVEWKSTSHPEPARFYASSSVVRDVTSVAAIFDIFVGDHVCLYGRSSDQRNCSAQVTHVGATCGSAGSQVQMSPRVGIGGDSGGGWSLGTTAYGLHKGNCGTDKKGFSLAIALDAALGVSVRTH